MWCGNDGGRKKTISYIDRLVQIVLPSNRKLGDLRVFRHQFLAGALKDLDIFISCLSTKINYR